MLGALEDSDGAKEVLIAKEALAVSDVTANLVVNTTRGIVT